MRPRRIGVVDFVLLLCSGTFVALFVFSTVTGVLTAMQGRYGFAVAWVGTAAMCAAFGVGAYRDTSLYVTGGGGGE